MFAQSAGRRADAMCPDEADALERRTYSKRKTTL
jgi:hypothetical protein